MFSIKYLKVSLNEPYLSAVGKIRNQGQGVVREHFAASINVVLQAEIHDNVAGLRRNVAPRDAGEHVNDLEGEDFEVGGGLRRLEGSKFTAAILHVHLEWPRGFVRGRADPNPDTDEGQLTKTTLKQSLMSLQISE